MIRLIPFIYSSDIAYPMELGEIYSSFFYDGALLDSDGAPIVTPYALSVVNEMQYKQIADTMWIVHEDYAQYKLTRTTTTTFSIDAVTFTRGPFLTRNDILNDDDVTMTPTATTGDTELTSSSAYFETGHVGALFKLTQPRPTALAKISTSGVAESSALEIKGNFSFNTHGTWTGTVELQRNNNSYGWEVYRTFIASNDRNIQFSATENDYDVEYRIVSTGSSMGSFSADLTANSSTVSGIARITKINSTTNADITVIYDFASTDATKRWAEGAWSDAQGYPNSICFYGNRCIYGSERMVWLSKVDDYENFDADVKDADSFSIALSTANEIKWLDTVDDAIVIGTSGAPWTVQTNKVGTPITPTNFTAREQAGAGSKAIQAVKVNNALLYVDDVGKKIREFGYNTEESKYTTPDMSVLAEHLTNDSSISGIAYQSNPESILWVWLADGTLLSFTYEREQNVMAWAEHPIDGDVGSVTVIPSTDEDEVWLAIERTVNGSDIICIERFADRILPTSIEDTFFVDSGVTYDSTTATSIPVAHLVGETVAILADGVVLDTQVVDASGNITLTTGAKVVQAGLPYTYQVSPMRMDISPNGSSTHGTTKRIPELVLSLLNSRDVTFGDSTSDLFDVDTTTADLINKSDITGLFTGDVPVHSNGGFSIDDSIVISGSKPSPCTVRAIVARTDITGR